MDEVTGKEESENNPRAVDGLKSRGVGEGGGWDGFVVGEEKIRSLDTNKGSTRAG